MIIIIKLSFCSTVILTPSRHQPLLSGNGPSKICILLLNDA